MRRTPHAYLAAKGSHRPGLRGRSRMDGMLSGESGFGQTFGVLA
jgi:hypothetical protein